MKKVIMKKMITPAAGKRGSATRVLTCNATGLCRRKKDAMKSASKH